MCSLANFKIISAVLLLTSLNSGHAAINTNPPSSTSAGAASLDKIPGSSSGPRTPAAIIVPIDAQLRDFRDGDVESAYRDTTSGDFKSATSLEAFKTFVEKNPILSKHKSIEVKTNAIQEQEANITVTLDPAKEAVPVNYLLVKENNQWKIWHMSVTPLYSEETKALMQDQSAMRVPIEAQLQALRDGNIPKAYQNFTSDAFKRAASLEAFRAYVKDFPVLSQPVSIDYKEPIFSKGTSLLEVHLNTETTTTVMEYTLGIEDDEWKIWGEKVLKQLAKAPSDSHPASIGESSNVRVTQTRQASDNTDSPSGKLEFSRIDIGGSLDVKNNKGSATPTLKSNQGDIYVNLYVRYGIFGTKIELQMEHLETHTRIPTISTTLDQDGNIEVSFVYSPPANGWPKGHYVLTAVASTGAVRTLPFLVE